MIFVRKWEKRFNLENKRLSKFDRNEEKSLLFLSVCCWCFYFRSEILKLVEQRRTKCVCVQYFSPRFFFVFFLFSLFVIAVDIFVNREHEKRWIVNRRHATQLLEIQFIIQFDNEEASQRNRIHFPFWVLLLQSLEELTNGIKNKNIHQIIHIFTCKSKLNVQFLGPKINERQANDEMWPNQCLHEILIRSIAQKKTQTLTI